MKYCACILALVFSFSALAGWMDGHSLLQILEGREKNDLGYSSGVFDGYVAGVSDLSVDILWCPPQNVNKGQIYKIVANYLKAHPESLHKDAVLLVVDALKSPFPC